MTRRRLLFCSLVCLWPWLSPDARAQTAGVPGLKQDLAFQHWGTFYFPGEDWRWFKAQGTAESALVQTRRSPCGAVGVMQLMPSTAKGLGVDALDAEENIRGGIMYDLQLWRIWPAIRSGDERRRYMFASYNAGPGNIRRAAQLAPAATWQTTAAQLARVTGGHAVETINYVKRITEYYLGMR